MIVFMLLENAHHLKITQTKWYMYRVPITWETEMEGSLGPESSGPSDSVVRSPFQK